MQKNNFSSDIERRAYISDRRAIILDANKQTSNNKMKKKPPGIPIQSKQMDLFSSFLTNDKEKISNTVEIWESIPKYSFSPAQQNKLRTPKGYAEPQEREYSYNEDSYALIIQPALIKQKKGGYKAFFPSATEEIIEETLKKFFSSQNHGYHDPKNLESWVKFSLSMIYKELKARGRTRSRNEIKHALEVLSSCILKVYKNDEEIWKGAILQDIVTIGRNKYLRDTESLHAARLPLFISTAINNLEYRQFNYNRLMSCDGQLSRWIHRQLINRFKQASMTTPYHFMFSTLKRDSCLLEQSLERENRKKIGLALDELIKENVLVKYEKETRKKGRLVIDVKYILWTTSDFSRDQKASNKRNKDNLQALKVEGLTTIK